MIGRIVRQGRLQILTVTSDRSKDDSPVLLFLHGSGEASEYINKLPLVCVHHSPPFQAFLGRLRDVAVVAPQAPVSPKNRWDWSHFMEDLCGLLSQFGDRQLFATGFSRGGLGVLQLLQACPKRVSRWAVIDPQPEASVLPKGQTVDPSGWLAYGTTYPEITAFSRELSQHLRRENVRPTSHGHGELALKAYTGENLGGTESVYSFLKLSYDMGSAV